MVSSRFLTFRRLALIALLFGVLWAPFAAKPIHVDDANFLMLAEGAACDPWRPHATAINWSGTTQPAFNRLANPPGIAWYLAPVRNAPEWLLHLCMLPWLVLASWGCCRLARRYTSDDGFVATVYLLTCPVIVLAAQALTPDLPLFACLAAGIGGFVTAPRGQWAFALLAGCAALFRYSGCAAIPLLALVGWQHRRWRGAAAALVAAIPIAALVAHDLHAYGRVHLLAMFASQNDLETRPMTDAVHNVIAGVAMLGGAAVLPVLVWRREALAGALIGASLGLSAALFAQQRLEAAVWTTSFTAAGAASLALALAPRVRQSLLSLWALGGAAFFFVVRFAAARYWAAFLPGVGLLAYRNAARRPVLLRVGIGVNVAVSLAVSLGDYEFARAQRSAAEWVAELGTGSFSGHWGWQHYLEQDGWVPIEEGGPTRVLHASSFVAAPQIPNADARYVLLHRVHLHQEFPWPRTHALYGGAGYHGGGRGSYAPWVLSNEPLDVVSVMLLRDAAVIARREEVAQ